MVTIDILDELCSVRPRKKTEPQRTLRRDPENAEQEKIPTSGKISQKWRTQNHVEIEKTLHLRGAGWVLQVVSGFLLRGRLVICSLIYVAAFRRYFCD